jgi:hypothetical protein
MLLQIINTEMVSVSNFNYFEKPEELSSSLKRFKRLNRKKSLRIILLLRQADLLLKCNWNYLWQLSSEKLIS